MDSTLILQILILAIGFYMAWNIGANDVSNAMGTSVGSGALTIKKAVILAAILEFSGAFFIGGNVTETMQRGLIQTQQFATEPVTLIIGMCGALLGASLWLQFASFYGLPVSTTHAIVGAILGIGVLLGGWDAIQWNEISAIGLSWVISPVLSGFISYLLFSALQRKIFFAMNPTAATKRFIPFLSSIVFGTFTLSLVVNGLGTFKLVLSFPQALFISLIVSALAGVTGYLIMRRIPKLQPELEAASHQPFTLISLEKAIKHLRRVRASSGEESRENVSRMLSEMHSMADHMRKTSNLSSRPSEYRTVERWFVYFQIISACFVAFAHGANDVSNAIGPIATVLSVLHEGNVSNTAPIPSWLLAAGGVGIVIGLATWGWRVIETIGKKITALTPTRGFCAEFGAALTILLASKIGMPVSTTHCLVGSVLGVGLGRGISALNLSTIKEIVLSWIVTIPASALMSILCYYLLKYIFT